MARPKGYRLNRPAFQDLIRAKRIDMSEAARMAVDRDGKPMPLTTLSDLVNGNCGASMATVRRLCEGLDCDDETLFPELGRYSFRYSDDTGKAA